MNTKCLTPHAHFAAPAIYHGAELIACTNRGHEPDPHPIRVGLSHARTRRRAEPTGEEPVMSTTEPAPQPDPNERPDNQPTPDQPQPTDEPNPESDADK